MIRQTRNSRCNVCTDTLQDLITECERATSLSAARECGRIVRCLSQHRIPAPAPKSGIRVLKTQTASCHRNASFNKNKPSPSTRHCQNGTQPAVEQDLPGRSTCGCCRPPRCFRREQACRTRACGVRKRPQPAGSLLPHIAEQVSDTQHPLGGDGTRGRHCSTRDPFLPSVRETFVYVRDVAALAFSV